MTDLSLPSNETIEDLSQPSREIQVTYTGLSVLIGIITVFGNAIIILVFFKNKTLQAKTANYYIVSLATADLLVGLFVVPFIIMGVISILDEDLHLCLFTLSVVVTCCAVSILNLVSISIDCYWSILLPIVYQQSIKKKKITFTIICLCWIIGVFFGFLPLFGWHNGGPDNMYCNGVTMLTFEYLLFLSIGVIIFPLMILVIVYAHIYYMIAKRARRLVAKASTTDQAQIEAENNEDIKLRVSADQQKQNIKVAMTLSIIVSFFTVCWIPLAVVLAMSAFCPNCYHRNSWFFVTIGLSHINSTLNPILYAYHLRGFKDAFKSMINLK